MLTHASTYGTFKDKFLTTQFFQIMKENTYKLQIMKSIIKDLFFDKELVKHIKEVKTDKNILYQQLISGRITLQEYLAVLQTADDTLN